MAGGSYDWEVLIQQQASLLLETKILVSKNEKILQESMQQSRQNTWTLCLAVLTFTASIVLPFFID